MSAESAPSGDIFSYSARDIDVLEGLEPVRRNPGMYIGGRDTRALHHLAAEVLDNAMDEVVARHATRIDITLHGDGSLEVRDDGRGIPVDPHPRYPDKSALEVVLTTLHAGGKFRRGEEGAYATSGGLHGVGISVVNALSDWLDVEVARSRKRWGMRFRRGEPQGKLESRGSTQNRRGTVVRFLPDSEIFGAASGFKAQRLYAMARSKAYLFKSVTVHWNCAPLLAVEGVPEKETFSFPGGLREFLESRIGKTETLGAPFTGEVEIPGGGKGGPLTSVHWALAWTPSGGAFLDSYANAIPTPEGGTHVAGLRDALRKALRAYGDLAGSKRASLITSEDILACVSAVYSVFLERPDFAGQTKERLGNEDVQKQVEPLIRDRFDHWLGSDPATADKLVDLLAGIAEQRMRQRAERETRRKSALKGLRLPSKLADCSNAGRVDTEIFLVEGDSAGGSAKQARDRRTQAVLPLRGKILNVANAAAAKLQANQELRDLMQALGVEPGDRYNDDRLRYDKVIIMTDADVDGAHIAALLMTFFFSQTPTLVENGHLYLATPPLYRIALGDRYRYALDDNARERLLATEFANGGSKVVISRFKGLGEMMPSQLRETTMDARTRQLVRITVEDGAKTTARRVEELMGRRPESRYQYIQKNARFAADFDS